ncbi:TIGR02678 family protein [Streptomyces sp. Tu10]|uniref:TIGR02678 family protein n=1 Tax=Streptomyces sp. Tu10 TaxID=2838018 RepID=UPI001BDC2546|nr:TIGR02678 family protein [Streptomyces sp. Tu10]MBT1105652.1 TIGR02678 family protein [Streptomyces sp. Tu10]
MSTLANQLVAAEREDIARAIRLLLAKPLITERSDAAIFDIIRRRQEPLTKWFDYTCGWSLVVESRRGYARLLKIRHTLDSSRPARRLRSGRAPFDRRRYILLCVTAAELLAIPVTTIGLLAGRVVQAIDADPALPPFDTTSRTERMAFVDVLRLLESYGALQVLDGTTETFVDSEQAKVLYRVDATLLMRLPAAPIGPSSLAPAPDQITDRFDDLLHSLVRERRYGEAPTHTTTTGAEQATVSDTQRNLWLRHSILRRLFDDPVLYRDDLTDDEEAYLASPTGRQILRRAAEQAGFALEERAEGLLLIDPDALATDTTFPDDSSTARIAALLLLEEVTGPAGGTTPEQLSSAASDLLRRFPQWAKAYQSTEGAGRLADDACTVLADFHLIHRSAGRILARPAAWRYRVTTTPPAATNAHATCSASDNTFEEEALW